MVAAVADVAMAERRRAPSSWANGSTRFFKRVALIGESQLGALRVTGPAMPQAIERLLATPMIRPRLPRIETRRLPP